MHRYEVAISEILQRVITVEASDKYKAAEIVYTMWLNDEIILTKKDFSDIDISDVEEIK